MQLQLSTAASLRANWLGIINVDVLAMADSEDKLGIAHHHQDNIVYSMRIKRSRATSALALLCSASRRIYDCVSYGTWTLETGPW